MFLLTPGNLWRRTIPNGVVNFMAMLREHAGALHKRGPQQLATAHPPHQPSPAPSVEEPVPPTLASSAISESTEQERRQVILDPEGLSKKK